MKVLIIEDIDYIKERINSYLSNIKDIDIKEVSESARVREFLKTESFDIIITEVYVKGISALEINHLAHQKNPDCCVIIITTIDNADIAQKAVKEGAFDFIIRPAQLEKLEKLIKLYINVRYSPNM